MYRLFAAFAVAVSFVCILTLSLSAQVDLPPTPFDPPPGTVITVTTALDDLRDNGNCTLREAIQAANTDTAVDGCPAGDGEDLIVLAAAVYALTLTGPSEDDNATGDLDIRSSMVISGAGAEETVIDANQIDRVFDVHADAAVGIYGLTLRNGHAPDGTREGCGDAAEDPCEGEPGGGLRNSGILTLTEGTLINNASGDGYYTEEYNNGHWYEYSADAGEGGGIANYGTVLVFRSVIIENRTGTERFSGGPDDNGARSGNGGGIANRGFMEIISSHVLSNTPEHAGWENRGGDGGGIWNTGVLSMTDSYIAFNQAGENGGCFKCYSNSSGDGGGIANQGTLSITSSIVHMNTTLGESRGAGLYNNGQTWVSTSRIDSNRILGAEGLFASWGFGAGGGGIYNEKTMIVHESSIYDNYIEFLRNGGGVLNRGVLSIINSTISGNQSGVSLGNGGGIFNRGILFLSGSTISHNTATTGYGTFCNPYWFDNDPFCHSGSGGGVANDRGVFSVYNSIIADNHLVGDGEGPDCLGTVVSYGHNLVGNMGSCSSTGLTHLDVYNQVAWLGPLADNGGPTPTHALLPQSSALNNGSCTTYDGTPITEDQRGQPRPQGQGCDIGAYESDLEYVPPEELFLPVIGKSGE